MGSARYKLWLRIKHPSRDLSAFCMDLGLVPAIVWNVGDQRRTPKGTMLPGQRQSSYCSIHFDDAEQSSLLEKMNSVLSMLKPHRSSIVEIDLSGGKVSFSIGWFSTDDSGQTVDWRILSAIADLRISLDTSVYCEASTSGEVIDRPEC
jgi:uncharacterized protein DUF4279